LPTFFASTLFVSAALLFLVQPMFARMVLPRFGGSPSVWNTCNFFFQAVLLAGYGYAHWMARRFDIRGQATLQLALLLVAFVVLPVSVADWNSSADANPVFPLLGVLFVSMGLPFFAVAASAPLLQRWFSGTNHPAARDPYFLYAASNLGSMLALLSYPILLEPNLRLADQSWLWTVSYGLLVALTLGCALLAWRRSSPLKVGSEDRPALQTAAKPMTTRLRLRLIALAFIPSSLLLSVTTYLTADIAAIPLLWVIPLAIYLLTFILTFARRPPIPPQTVNRVFPLVMIVLAVIMLSEATEPMWLLLVLHLLGLFVVGLFCHGEIAARRPAVEQLTEFYLWVALGGVLGGLFNAVLAPLIFPGLVEYPLALVAACLLRQGSPLAKKKTPQVQWHLALGRWRWVVARADLLFPLAVGLLTAGLILVLPILGVEPGPASVGLAFGVPVILCYIAHEWTLRFGLSLGAVFLAGLLYPGVSGRVLYRARDFFGVHRVTLDPRTGEHKLFHGNTLHGKQDPKKPREPLTYYHRSGPVGQLFKAYSEADAKKRVGVVGLGAGSLLAYSEPGQEWTYFEIDPTVERIAKDPRFFTFWSNCRAKKDVILGDARLQLQSDTRQYDLLIIDAFSSDAIPLHLLTREALEIYLERLADKGVMAFHISNRYLDLHPVLANLAYDKQLVCWAQDDPTSHWVVMARQQTTLDKLVNNGLWRRLQHQPELPVWTDDYCNLLGVFR
jgi:hypothetical protein